MNKHFALIAMIGMLGTAHAAFVAGPDSWAGWRTLQPTVAPKVVSSFEWKCQDLAGLSELGFEDLGFFRIQILPPMGNLEWLPPSRTFALTFPKVACPDRPEIPSWAWAWELSTPEGW